MLIRKYVKVISRIYIFETKKRKEKEKKEEDTVGKDCKKRIFSLVKFNKIRIERL